ncbi:hypothetical protein Pfo_017198 [Paulownia fortunei]|nr:hypothetical protein Pfo_017198 [Paulownia fortunei]
MESSNHAMLFWRTACSLLARFRKWVQRKGWWTVDKETELSGSIRKQDIVAGYFSKFTALLHVLHLIRVADKMEKLSDVYDHLPANLHEQQKLLRNHSEASAGFHY